MKNKLSQHQRFLQKMALTPQMRQSLNILGMSVQDLVEYVDFALTQNPFLKKLTERKPLNKHGGEPSQPFDKSIKQDENPRQTLLSQIKMSGLMDDMLEIAEYLIYEMDDNGYITIEPEEAAADLGVDTDEISECLSLIKDMEPAGIGAGDIKECLQLQLKRKGMENSLEWRIVDRYLSEVAQENIEKIAKDLKTDNTKVREAVRSIKELNPRPASTILARESKKVIPELVAKVDDKKVRLELNRGTVPDLKLYNPYENDFAIIKDPEARKFMKENMNAAKSLIDNLKRREATVCKVADYILAFQRQTLARGGHDINSLTIKEVAHATNFHPSTISRAISNKYIQVNDKVMPLNSLLSHGIRHSDGKLMSKTCVKKIIEELVKHEDPYHPASDSDLQKVLKKVCGVNISRRTVAKYRASLRILPAHLRKKFKTA